MDIEQLKSEVVYSEDQNRLFEISIILTEEISLLHIELIKSKEELERAEIKAKIAQLSRLQIIIDKRIDGVIHGELYNHRRFRTAANLVLKKETYERLIDLSLLSHKDMNKLKKDYKNNKLE